MSQILFPDSPNPGDSIVGANGVIYTYDEPFGPGVEGVWLAGAATPTNPLTITNPGTIAGSPQVNATLTYTPGTATGGVGAISYTWQWFITPSTPLGAANAPTVTVPAGALGQNIYVKLTATDSATPTANIATADTANFPSSGTITPAGITGAAAPTTIPGTASFTWADAPGTLTAGGCIEFSVDAGANWVTSASVTNAPPTTVLTRWVNVPLSGTCGDSAGNAAITGTLTSGSATSTFNFTMDRTPNAITLVPNIETTTPNTVTTADPTFSIAGTDAPSFIWGSFATTGGTPEFTVDAGTTWTAIPTAPGAATVNPGATVSIRFTTGAAAGSEVYTVNVGASTTAGQFQSGAFTVTVATAPFPGFSTTPAGGPNASPDTTALAGPSLYGTAVGAAWVDGTTSINTTGSLQYKIGAGAWGQAAQTVNNSDIISLRWNPTAMVAVDGTILNGTLTDGTYTNAYTVTVTNQPGAYTWTDVPAGAGGSAVSTLNTSNVVNISGINAPAELIYTPDGTNPLTSVEAAIAGGGWTPIPTTSPGLVINPADSVGTTATTLQIRGITGAALNTAYKITTKIGDGTTWVTDEWSVGTVAASPSVTAPNIVTPAAGSTNVGTPSGITITADAYAASGGAGAQTSSTWEVYKNSYPLQSANTITNVTQNAGTSPSGTVSITGGGGYCFTSFAGRLYLGRAYSTDNGASWIVGSGPNSPSKQYVVAGGVMYGVDGSGNIQKTTDGLNWSSITGSIGAAVNILGTDGTNLLATNNVAIGGFFGLYRSTDGGANWTQVIGSLTTPVRAISYVNNRFVVWVGQFVSTIYVSTNGGANWTPTASNIPVATYPAIPLTIEYAFGKYFFAGMSGGSFLSGDARLYSSTDLASWTRDTSIDSLTGNTAVWYGPLSLVGGELYVAQARSTTASSLFYKTSDGTNWSAVTTPFSPAGKTGGQVVEYNGNVIFAVNDGSGFVTTKGAAPSTTLAIANAVADGFLAGDTVVSGSGAAAGPATILSLDNSQVTVAPQSTNWVGNNTQTLARDSSSYAAVTGSPFTVNTGTLTSLTIPKPPLEANTKYWVRAQYATTNTAAATSPFGGWSDFTTGSLIPTATTWVSQTTGTAVSLYGSAFGNGVFIAAGGGTPSSAAGLILSSPDGVNWTTRYNVTAGSGQLNGAVYGGGLFVTVGGNGVILSSLDGVTWTTQTSGTPSDFNKVAYNGSQYLAVQGATANVFTSPNAVTWTSRATGASGWQGAAWNGSVWCIVGNSGRVRTSPDAITWTARTSGVAVILQDVVYTGSQFVAVGQSGTIITSPDGTTWTTRTSGSTAVLNNICYGGGLLVVTGNGGVILTSTDGITWASQTSGTAQSLYQTSYSGSMFAAAGSGGNVFTSVS